MAYEALTQVFHLERDTGLLCRILGFYSARGLTISSVAYACTSPDVMTLTVETACDSSRRAEELRVLTEKAASLIGVIAVE